MDFIERVEWRKWGRNISMFLFSRYPIANGLTFLMLLGERAKREKVPPIDPNIIYGHVGIFIGAGLAMGFNFRRKEACFLHIIQLMYLAYIIQTNDLLKYKAGLRAKICIRMLGTTGFYFLYLFFVSLKPRPQFYRRIGETIVGIYAACYLYQLLTDPIEKEAFTRNAIGENVTLFIYAILVGSCALCFIPGLFVVDITQAFLLALWFGTTSVDLRLHYWTKKIGVDYWIQVRLAMDHVAMMLGCVMYLSCTTKVISVDLASGIRPQDDPDTEVIEQFPREEGHIHAHPDPMKDSDNEDGNEDENEDGNEDNYEEEVDNAGEAPEQTEHDKKHQ